MIHFSGYYFLLNNRTTSFPWILSSETTLFPEFLDYFWKVSNPLSKDYSKAEILRSFAINPEFILSLEELNEKPILVDDYLSTNIMYQLPLLNDYSYKFFLVSIRLNSYRIHV